MVGQITGKLAQAQNGRYFIYLGAVVGSSGLIKPCLTASLMRENVIDSTERMTFMEND